MTRQLLLLVNSGGSCQTLGRRDVINDEEQIGRYAALAKEVGSVRVAGQVMAGSVAQCALRHARKQV